METRTNNDPDINRDELRTPVAPPRQAGPAIPASSAQPTNYQPINAQPPSVQPRPAQPSQQQPQQLPPRPPLQRADSRQTIPAPNLQSPLRPNPPNYPQQFQQNIAPNSPQFQPGGAVNTSQFQPRPLQQQQQPYPPRAPVVQASSLQPQQGVPGQYRQPLPQQRPSGPQSFAPQQVQRPQAPSQSTPLLPPRGPPLQTNPQYVPQQILRQPLPLAGQPGNKPQIGVAPPQQQGARPILEHQNSYPQRPVALPSQLSRQSSQGSLSGSDLPSTPTFTKNSTLDNLGNITEKQGTVSADNGVDNLTGSPKNRSYSIAGSPLPSGVIKPEDDRRRSVSAISGKSEDSPIRISNLGNIQEIKSNQAVKDVINPIARNLITGSKESVKSDGSNESGKHSYQVERPDSRLSNSRMTDSIIGSLNSDTRTPPKSPAIHTMNLKRSDDDDDVVIQRQISNNIINSQTNSAPSPIQKSTPGVTEPVKHSAVMSDRSPSLNQSDSSPDTKKSPSPEQRSDSRLSNIARPSSISPNDPKTPEPHSRGSPVVTSTISSPTPRFISDRAPSAEVRNSPIPQAHSPKPQFAPQIHNGTVNYDRPVSRAGIKPTDFQPPIPENASNRTTPRRVVSAPRGRDGDNDSGVDEFTQGHEVNGSPGSPTKKSPSKIPGARQPNGTAGKTLPLSRSPSKSAAAPKTPDSTTSNTSIDKKKVPMNKVQVGNAPSPNIKAVKSKIGSLENATYKPGGGKVKIESRKLDFKAAPKIAAKNETYTPSGGEKKITQQKLQWNAKSKIGSLENASHRPGGGDKKIESVKLDFKDKAKPKVASTVNIHHKAGGGAIKIETQKVDIKAQSKVGSLDNVKHKAGGGEVKIFDDKEYIKQMSATSQQSNSGNEDDDDYYVTMQEFEEYDREERAPSRCRSAMYRHPSPLRGRKSRKNSITEETTACHRPKSAREANLVRNKIYPSVSACNTPRRGVGILPKPRFSVY